MSISVIATIIAVLAVTIVAPLGIMFLLHKRGGAWRAFFIGAGTFVLFAMILEPILHNVVLRSGAGAAIQSNIWLYGLYGGLAAGLFEETGRFLAFRFLLRNQPDRITALACGIGHGGGEAFLLVGLTMISNLILGLTYANAGTLPPEIAPAVEALLATPASAFLWSGLERLSAITLHLSLSVLVFASLRTGKRWLFPAAILMHAVVDFVAVVSNASLPVAATEGLILLVTACAAVWAARIYKKLPKNAENS